MLPARPSASVSSTRTVTGFPAASAPVNTGEASASTPTMSDCGASARATIARAGEQAAAAERTSSASRSGCAANISSATVPPRDDIGVVVRRDVGAPLVAASLRAEQFRVVVGAVRIDDLGSEPLSSPAAWSRAPTTASGTRAWIASSTPASAIAWP
jgi:hypothetical protein